MRRVGNIFCFAPPLFWLYKYNTRYGERYRDGQYGLVSLLFTVRHGAPCDPVPFGGRRHCLFFFREMLSTAHGAENFAFADTKSTPLLHKFDFPSAQMFSEVNLLV